MEPRGGASGAKAAYRLFAGAITGLSVALQYWFSVVEPSSHILVSSIRFFSFFTILTNALAAVALLLPTLAPNSAAGRFLERPGVRTGLAGYIVMVGVVYFLLLRGVSHQSGWALFLEGVLHYVTPPLFVLDWLLFVPKANVGWRVGPGSLGFPLVYAAWMLALGAVSGWYPYPFVDVPDLGYPRALANIAGLIVAFLGLELAMVGLARIIGRAGPSAGRGR